MARKTSRRTPYDPAAAVMAQAQLRAEERIRRRDPASWGVANDTLALPSGEGVEHYASQNRREVIARRLDPFQALYQRKALSVAQHQAAIRLFRDWCISEGVRTEDPRPVLEFREPAPRLGPSDLVNVRMIDARDRLQEALRLVGPAQARVLKALISPVSMCGSVVIWRAVVERVTGETHTHAQAAVVRLACEDLRLVYERIDACPAAGAGLRSA